MVENVNPLGPVKGPSGPSPAGRPEQAEGERSFKEILQDSIDKVNSFQQEADLMLEKFRSGEATEDQLVIATQKARISFEALMQIRNKLVDAFEEIQRMRI